MPYYNYLGQLMPESGTETGHIDGTSAGNETIQAPAGNTAIAGDGGGDLLIGSAGDNRFYIDDIHDRIQEQPNAGIDTEIGYTSLILAPNVENLTVHGDFNYAVGNSLDNIVTVDGSQWLNGMAGDDVLVGSTTQRTTFQVSIGQGDDVIYNWNGNSQLQLLNAPDFQTAAQVRAAMTQSGGDTILHLSATETLTFRGITPAALTDRQFLAPLDKSQLGAMTFDDEFNNLNIVNPSLGTGVWNTNFGGNLKDQYAYTLVPNGELEAYVAPGFQGRGVQDIGVNPFSVSNGILTITAAPTSPDAVYPTWGAQFTSGMLNTEGTFAQKYGYFEMRAEMPTAQGAWPAFWMLPNPYQPNAEADITEGLGATPNVDYVRAYGGANGSETQYDNVLNTSPGGFHTYGMMWTAKTVTFYFDGIEVLQGPTPSTWTSPMAMLVNLAVGGWGGKPDAAAFPAHMQVDYVHAYALADGSSQVVTGPPTQPVDTLIDNGASSGQTNSPVAFEAGGAAVTTSHISLSSAPPAILPAGQTMMIWEDSGAVFGATSDGVTLSTPTALMAGTISQFTGAGTWLTDGKVVFAYEQANAAGGQDLWDDVFNPATKTFVRQDLGATAVNAHATFVATAHGGFAVSWDGPDGAVVARGYDEYAYGGDVPGWYGPTRQVTGALTGVTADGHVIAANGSGQELYTLSGASTYSPTTISIQTDPVMKPEGNSGVTPFAFTVTRTGDTSAATSVTWTTTGSGAHPADAMDFQGGVLPSGAVNFAAGQASQVITLNVVGDTTAEPDDTFTVTLSNPTGAGVGLQNAAASGIIQNDDGSVASPPPPPASPPPPPPASSGQVLTASSTGSTLVGGAGDDTLNGSQGGDVLTGGAGSDHFVFGKEPWSPETITDFKVGTDKLDLSALLTKSGYAGSDPIADHYVTLLDDGAGGTKVLFDADGPGPNPQWGNYIVHLDNVPVAGLTWAGLSGSGGASPPPPPGSPPPPPASGGSGQLVVFAGQSNMGVYGTDPSTVTSRWSPDALTQIWNPTANKFEAMHPGVNTGYGGQPNGWGPEVEFAIDFRAAHPSVTLYIVKSVAGGTQLAQDTAPFHADWSPLSSGELFDQTTQMIHAASSAAGGILPNAVYFGQGEEDANTQANAQAYGTNLTNFFSAVRSTWLQNSTGKIGFFEIGTSPPFSAQVRSAQLGVDQADANAASFDSSTLPLQADGLHFATAGVNTEGDDFFQMYQSWTPAPSGGPSGGQVFTSSGPGSTIVGGGGDDTIIGSQGGDVLTGGAGADKFSFPSEPWSPERITDFTLGVDKLDLSSLFNKFGYSGSDPVADHYVSFIDDGAGGTKVLFDHDGPGPSPQWGNYIIQLDHVAASGLTWAALAGGSTPISPPPPPTSPPPPPVSPPPPPAPGDTVETAAASYTLSGQTHNLVLDGAAAQTGIGSSLDNTITSNDYGSTLQGLDGNDTLVAGHGADVLTGGAGADVFQFKVLPWNAGHITDFVVGTDRLDLSPLFSASGYSGSDPVKDGYVILSSNGAGGTTVSFDSDGPGTANPWPTTITTLDHVSSAGLTWAQLSSGGGAPAPPTPGGGGGTPGQVLTSSSYGATLTGGAGADTLNAGQGPDVLTGGAGSDHFAFAKPPWNAGHITDFSPGSDLLDLRQLFAQTSYSGANPLADNWLQFRADGSGNTQVYVDTDGPSGGNWPTLVTTLDHVSPGQISAGDWIFH
jgi:Ca2+-binding RTX toxin-like protein